MASRVGAKPNTSSSLHTTHNKDEPEPMMPLFVALDDCACVACEQQPEVRERVCGSWWRTNADVARGLVAVSDHREPTSSLNTPSPAPLFNTRYYRPLEPA